MDMDRAFLIICLTVGAVVLFNVMIYLSLRRGNEVTTIDLLRKASRRARNPWQDEDDALQELSELVAGLRTNQEQSESKEEQEDPNDR
jgi:hypothetical protein